MARAVFTIRDHSGEYSSVGFPIAEPAADGSDYQTVITDKVAALQTGLQIMTAGHVARRYVVVDETLVNDTAPVSPFAQRELKWSCRYQDQVNGKRYTISLPCAAAELKPEPGSDELDITLSAIGAFVSWFDNNFLSPAGNAVKIEKITLVGRNI